MLISDDHILIDEASDIDIKLINKFILKKIGTDKFDESFYIVDLDIITKLYIKWITKLPNIKPYYAIKCNPNNNIIELLGKLGCNFDCASRIEIQNVLNIINDENRIIYANPCKPVSHIKYANDNNVKLFTFDCVEELYKIREYCNDSKVILRLAVDDSKSLCKFNSKFGCKLENIETIYKCIKDLDMNLVGLSFHVGSGCNSADSYYTALKDCRYAFEVAKSKYNINLNIIDIGGGFSGRDKNDRVSFDEIVEKIKEGQNDFFSDININYMAEPGRYFTETSHTLIINVTSKKKEKDVIKYYVNDGAYGSFNCIHYDHQLPILKPLRQINKEDTLYNSTFFGPTCDSMDIIYKDIMMPELYIGDWLYVENFGSYTNAPGASFNGFKTIDIIYISTL